VKASDLAYLIFVFLACLPLTVSRGCIETAEVPSVKLVIVVTAIQYLAVGPPSRPHEGIIERRCFNPEQLIQNVGSPFVSVTLVCNVPGQAALSLLCCYQKSSGTSKHVHVHELGLLYFCGIKI
jgi:hypothetical protein